MPLSFFSNARSSTSVETKHIGSISGDMSYRRSSDQRNNLSTHLVTHSSRRKLNYSFNLITWLFPTWAKESSHVGALSLLPQG